MPLKAGRQGDLAGSMAKDTEDAFRANWGAFMGDDLAVPDTNHPQMRLLFVAVAQGVIKHLKDKDRTSFIVTEFDEDVVPDR